MKYLFVFLLIGLVSCGGDDEKIPVDTSGALESSNKIFKEKLAPIEEKLGEAFEEVKTTYQRRAELITQMIATVQDDNENLTESLTELTQIRAGIVNAETSQEMDLMGKKINDAINLAFEEYPQIRSSENFMTLQAQLEGTENIVVYARKKYNSIAKEYNAIVNESQQEYTLIEYFIEPESKEIIVAF